jgi:hypothetical protein
MRVRIVGRMAASGSEVGRAARFRLRGIILPLSAPLHEGEGLVADAQPAFPGRGHAERALHPDAEGRVLDMTAVGVSLLSWLSLQDLPGGSGRASDIWGYQSPSGREYALIGLEKGTAFVDLTDPSDPHFAGSWEEHYVHDAVVTTYPSGPYAGREIAFACLGQVGFAINDITNKGAMTTHVTSFTNGNPAIDHNPIGSGTILFQANYLSGLRIYDVADPGSAQEIGYFDT